MNTPLVKLRYQQLDLFNSDALTSAYKAHVFQLHVHHSLSCVPLRQYRACVVDSLGPAIMCIISLYYVYKASRSCPLCFLCHPHSNLKNFLCPCFLTYGYNAGPPTAIPIYTVLPYCVIQCTYIYVASKMVLVLGWALL